MKWKPALWLCAFALPAFFLWPIDTLVIRLAPSANETGQEALFAAPAPLGQEFSTEYLHSVQLTPVQDIYRIVDGRIWSWQERVMSHNAGLPFARPPFGRFRADPPWMVFEGGRQFLETIFLRVGNAELGRNQFFYGATHTALYERFPGKRLQLFVERRSLVAFLKRCVLLPPVCVPRTQSFLHHDKPAFMLGLSQCHLATMNGCSTSLTSQLHRMAGTSILTAQALRQMRSS